MRVSVFHGLVMSVTVHNGIIPLRLERQRHPWREAKQKSKSLKMFCLHITKNDSTLSVNFLKISECVDRICLTGYVLIFWDSQVFNWQNPDPEKDFWRIVITI